MTERNFINKIPEILLAQLAAFSLVYGLTSSLLLTYSPYKILLMVILSVALLYLFFYNRVTAIAASILIGTVVLASFIYIIFGVGMTKAFKFFDDYFYWLGDYIQYADTPNDPYQFITVLTLVILMSVFSYIFLVRRFLFLVVAIFGIGMFAFQCSYQIISSMVPFYIYLFVTLCSYLKHIYMMKTYVAANEYAKPWLMTIWSVPICIIVISISAAFYASDKPIEWKWLDKKIVAIYNYFSRNLDYEAFDYFSLASSSGFGDRNNILGGRVRLDRTNVLKVVTTRNVYLKGSVQDVYTGSHWEAGSTAKKPIASNYSPLYEDTDEMLEGIKLLAGNKVKLKDYLYKNEIDVTFLNLKTKTLFLPEKTLGFKPKSSLSVLADKSGSVSTSKRLSKGFRYAVDMYTPAIGTKEFSDILRKSKRGLYSEYLLKSEFPSYFVTDDNSNLVTAIGVLGGPDIVISTNSALTSGSSLTTDSAVTFVATFTAITTGASHLITYTNSGGILKATTAAAVTDSQKELTEKLATYQKVKKLKEESDRIYSTCLKLPENLPQRVRDLASSLVANCTSDYDKAKAIEQYLSKNYPYNLDVRSTPRNRDFVDYFLFDLKQGYCSYYASAMAVLARSVGLPARYVEGYMLPPEPVKGNTSTYIVTNMQAHAWVEIYFEGYGWLPFEPTSPFSANFYSSKETEAVFASTFNSAYEDYMELMRKYGRRDLEPGGITDIEVQKEKTPTNIIILISMVSLILLFGLALLLNAARNKFRLYRIVNMPAKECVLRFYDYYVDVLSLIGLGLEPAETPAQYSVRIDSEVFFSPVRFNVITEIFIKARYSLKEVTEKEKQLFCDFHQGFHDEIKINMGKSKYFFNKFIRGRF